MSTYLPLCIISIWLLLILLASTLAKKYFPKEHELSRKIVHIGTGPIILIAWWFQIPQSISIGTAALITLGLIINYRYRLINSIEDIQRKSFGTISYGLSITILLILLWPENCPATSYGILAMAFGDGFAGLIGKSIKSPNWEVLGQKKSIAGTLTMGVILVLLIFSLTAINNIQIDTTQIIILTSIGILLEQVSPMGIDNLTVPIGSALTWIWITT